MAEVKRKTRANGHTLTYSGRAATVARKVLKTYEGRMAHVDAGGTAVMMSYAWTTPLKVQFKVGVQTQTDEWGLVCFGWKRGSAKRPQARWVVYRTSLLPDTDEVAPPWHLHADEWEPEVWGPPTTVTRSLGVTDEGTQLLRERTLRFRDPQVGGRERKWVAPWPWDRVEPGAVVSERMPLYAFADWCEEGGWPDCPEEFLQVMRDAVN